MGNKAVRKLKAKVKLNANDVRTLGHGLGLSREVLRHEERLALASEDDKAKRDAVRLRMLIKHNLRLEGKLVRALVKSARR